MKWVRRIDGGGVGPESRMSKEVALLDKISAVCSELDAFCEKIELQVYFCSTFLIATYNLF